MPSELNDPASRLDNQAAAVELREELAPWPGENFGDSLRVETSTTWVLCMSAFPRVTASRSPSHAYPYTRTGLAR
jgi:hypothetical protein